MTPRERSRLLLESIPAIQDAPTSRRFAARRVDGRIEFFEAKLTQVVDDEPEYHGHPTSRVPAKVLRRFRDSAVITEAEYRRLIKELG